MSLTFAEEVQAGLSSNPKFLSSKYFYDEKGDELFQVIMKMPEYYLTRSEYEVFTTHKAKLLSLFSAGDKPFQLIEFGAGDGFKTKVLLRHFLAHKANFKYSPIDISKNVLVELEADLAANLPDLEVDTLNDEYFTALDRLDHQGEIRKAILFLGSNIGNFNHEQAVAFLHHLREKLTSDDYLVVGFDLKKDPEVVLNAYNDSHGITRTFNLNLLRRINDELGGNFDIPNFKHWPTYNPMTGATKSYLVSTRDQDVYIDALDESFTFRAWEAVDMEISQKYDKTMIQSIASQAGFEIHDMLYDCKHNFVNAVLNPF